MKLGRIFFIIFTVSGFSGLIYESIWTLKLFLGHAAYAQTLVLAIFMGGMAIGSALCSRFSARWRNLLMGYAVTEGCIGLCALVFHNVFDGTVNFAYSTIIPSLASPLAVSICKRGSAILILPQSILLGMTFPLMSADFCACFPSGQGTRWRCSISPTASAPLVGCWPADAKSPYAGGMSAMEKGYLAFFQALGKRNPAAVASTAKMLLAGDPGLTPARRSYLVAAGMLGALARGDRQGAIQLWKENREALFGREEPNIIFRFLASQCLT